MRASLLGHIVNEQCRRSVLVTIVFFLVATQPESKAQDAPALFENEPSIYCGVTECETKIIYNVCEHRECGVIRRSEDCGPHWTSWHRIGGGHGNPCPNGCRRVGGALGYDYRSVGFPPRLQERNKYQCEPDVERFASCEHPVCGVQSRVQSGNIRYASCAHPSHGVGQLENLSPELQELAHAMADTYRGATGLAAYDEQYEDAVRLTLEYIRSVAVRAPTATRKQVQELAQIFKSKNRGVSIDDIAIILSAEVALPLLVNLPDLDLTCKLQIEN